MSHSQTLTKRMNTVIAASFVMLATTISSVNVAQADPQAIGNHSPSDSAGVLPCSHASVTIEIPKGNPYDDPAPGSNPADDGSGYSFTLSRVKNHNLGNPAEWENIGKLRADDITPSDLSDEKYTKLSAKGGAVRFTHLPVGMYLVTVQTPSSAANQDVADFLISLPVMETDGWRCDATIYAKKTPKFVPPAKTTEPPSPPRKLPKTGVETQLMLGATVALAGAGAVLIGSRKSVRKDRDN